MMVGGIVEALVDSHKVCRQHDYGSHYVWDYWGEPAASFMVGLYLSLPNGFRQKRDRSGFVAWFWRLGLCDSNQAENFIASSGPLNTFMYMGFLIVTVVLSSFMRFPPPNYKPVGWNPPQPAGGVAAKVFTTGSMLSTASFYGLWLCYTIELQQV